MKELFEMTMTYFEQAGTVSEKEAKLAKLRSMRAGEAYNYFINSQTKHDQYTNLFELLDLYTIGQTYSTHEQLKKTKDVIQFMIIKNIL
jgi:hypothetical protein